MPQLVLILCSVFVYFLLRLDHKQAPESSKALWIPTAWALVTWSKALGIWFQYSGEGGEDAGSPLDRTFLIILLCLGLLVILKRHINWAGILRENRYVAVIFGYMLISILWSPQPDISFKRFIKEVVALTMILLIVSENDPKSAVKTVIRRTIYFFMPFSLILIKFFPILGRRYNRWSGELQWIGVSGQKNGMAFLCAFSAFFFIWGFVERQKGSDHAVAKYQTYVEILLLGLSFYLMAGPKRSLTYSATSTICLAIGLITMMILLSMRKRGKAIRSTVLAAICILIMIYGIATPFLGKLALIDITSMMGRTEDLTGRAGIWAKLIPFAMAKPILGHGVGGFWTDAGRDAFISSHNGYLEMILNLGFLGLSLFLMLFVSWARRAPMVMAADTYWGIFFICWLIMGLFYSISESSLTSFKGMITSILVIISIASSKDSNIKATPR
jgi:exopolysaccharide production protein ExoQ